MANEIYNSSWWGVGACNDIGWGIVYKPYAGCETLFESRYISRVAAAGGTTEATSCITNLGLDVYDWDYYFRVMDDGTEKYIDGDFSSSTGWSLVGDFVISGGKASITNASQYSQLTQVNTTILEAGKTYILEMDIDNLSISDAFAYRFTGGSVIKINTSDIVDGKFTAQFQVTSNGSVWFQTTGSYTGLNVTIDNVSIKTIPKVESLECVTS